MFSLLAKRKRNQSDYSGITILPDSKEIFREFDIETNASEVLFNEYDIVQKNKLQHFSRAKSMYDFIKIMSI